MKKMYTIIFGLLLLAACSKEEPVTFENIDLIGEWSVAKLRVKTEFESRTQIDAWNYIRGNSIENRDIDATILMMDQTGSVEGKKLQVLDLVPKFEWEKNNEQLILRYTTTRDAHHPSEDASDLIRHYVDEVDVNIIDRDKIILDWHPQEQKFHVSYKLELERL